MNETGEMLCDSNIGSCCEPLGVRILWLKKLALILFDSKYFLFGAAGDLFDLPALAVGDLYKLLLSTGCKILFEMYESFGTRMGVGALVVRPSP